MAFAIKKFRISPKMLSEATVEGFVYDGTLQRLVLDSDSLSHWVEPFRLDSGTNGCPWGRYILDISLPRGSTFMVHYFATDVEIPHFANASQVIGAKDGLLYEQKGRYLYLWIQVLGATEGSLGQMTIWTPGDPFMQTFPQVFREEGGFFHRYLSVFSSIYMDFQDKIDALHRLVDVEYAPKEMLPHIGAWLGIKMSDQLYDEDMMRAILREAAFLHGHKGTKQVVVRLAEMITGQSCVVIERSALQGYHQLGDMELINRLYGETVYDYTILIPGKPDALMSRKLQDMLHQFQPVRANANLVFLQNSSTLGAYTYLDVNAALQTQTLVTLGDALVMDGGTCLK